MGVTFRNCAGGVSVSVDKGVIVEEEQSEIIDCKGMEIRPLSCTIALRVGRDLEEMMENPYPSKEFLDSLALGGVGIAIVPKGRSDFLETKEESFILDPMLPPEEIPEGKAIIQRSLTPESSFGYKERYGEWPIKHLGDKIKNKIILNPFWVTTWEIKLIDIPAFIPELGPLWGISSPIPPELRKAVYSPIRPFEGPHEAARIAELLMRSHYWSKHLKVEHLDEACWKFAGEKPPRLKAGEKARFWIGHKWVKYYINGKVFFPDELEELALTLSQLELP
ncbi:hypothetical protein IPA_01730 [Ignicoccus pacificus DSM 13166]|uniref:Uncharacterized protein n=1 Tax=Ignicoccus pacificus DSM 13166 TaxID=940294 RepID=A0A977PJU5_9CREN|nr:hypothetical protein IPA_01730 [Ignicoccus pacificus DSM 13166]